MLSEAVGARSERDREREERRGYARMRRGVTVYANLKAHSIHPPQLLATLPPTQGA